MSATDVPEHDWGCLHVWLPREEALEAVRAAVKEAYGPGFEAVEWTDPVDAVERLLGKGIPPLAENASGELGEDEVMVLEEGAPGWIAVMSKHWEWAPPSAHPLARAISRRFATLSIASHRGRYAEYTRYEKGAAVEATFLGPKPPALGSPLPELDLRWFQDKGAVVEAGELRAVLSDPDHFTTLAGMESRGLRDAFDAAPLEDYEPESYLILRAKTR